MIVIVRHVFHEGNKYYPQIFLNECLYKLKMLEYNKIEAFEDIDFSRTNGWREYIICHYWHFLKIKF